MLGNNAKNVVKQVLSGGNTVGLLPATDVSGITRYIADFAEYPAVVNQSFTLNAANAGISVGSGSTAPTDSDYQLRNTITSGLSGTVTSTKNVDSNGNASITFSVTITNTSINTITISEIGYKQTIDASDTLKGITATGRVFLLDRSVFNTITLNGSEQAVIEYTLKSSISNSGGVVASKSITANGTYYALDDSLDGYSSVSVQVPSSATLGTKTITQNGIYNALADNYDGYSQVTVNVSGGGGGSIPFITGENYMFYVVPDNDCQTLYANTGKYYIVMVLVSYSGGGGNPQLSSVTNATFTQIGTMIGDNSLPRSCVFTLYFVEKIDETLDSNLTCSDMDICNWIPLRGNPTLGTITKDDDVLSGEFSFNMNFNTETCLLISGHRLAIDLPTKDYTIRMCEINKKHYLCGMGRYDRYIFSQIMCVENDGSNTAAVHLHDTDVERAAYCYIPISFN